MTKVKEWHRWWCPKCGAEHEDPEDIFSTSCGNCGVIVFLLVADDGEDSREVILENERIKLV